MKESCKNGHFLLNVNTQTLTEYVNLCYVMYTYSVYNLNYCLTLAKVVPVLILFINLFVHLSNSFISSLDVLRGRRPQRLWWSEQLHLFWPPGDHPVNPSPIYPFTFLQLEYGSMQCVVSQKPLFRKKIKSRRIRTCNERGEIIVASCSQQPHDQFLTAKWAKKQRGRQVVCSTQSSFIVNMVLKHNRSVSYFNVCAGRVWGAPPVRGGDPKARDTQQNSHAAVRHLTSVSRGSHHPEERWQKIAASSR